MCDWCTESFPISIIFSQHQNPEVVLRRVTCQRNMDLRAVSRLTEMVAEAALILFPLVCICVITFLFFLSCTGRWQTPFLSYLQCPDWFGCFFNHGNCYEWDMIYTFLNFKAFLTFWFCCRTVHRMKLWVASLNYSFLRCDYLCNHHESIFDCHSVLLMSADWGVTSGYGYVFGSDLITKTKTQQYPPSYGITIWWKGQYSLDTPSSKNQLSPVKMLKYGLVAIFAPFFFFFLHVPPP